MKQKILGIFLVGLSFVFLGCESVDVYNQAIVPFQSPPVGTAIPDPSTNPKPGSTSTPSQARPNPIIPAHDLSAGPNGINLASHWTMFLDGTKQTGIFELTFDGGVNDDYRPVGSPYLGFVAQFILPLAFEPGKALIQLSGFTPGIGFQEAYYPPGMDGLLGAVERPSDGAKYLWGNCRRLSSAAPIYRYVGAELDAGFQPPALAGNPPGNSEGCGAVESVIVDSQDESRLYVLGNITTPIYQGNIQAWGFSKIVRLSATTGAVDTSYQTSFQIVWPIFYGELLHNNHTMVQDSNSGKIYLANVNYTNTLSYETLVRLNTDGSRDTTFSLQADARSYIGSGASIRDMVFDAERDRLYIASACPGNGGRSCVTAVKPDGSLDGGFAPLEFAVSYHEMLIDVDKNGVLYVAARLPHPLGGMVPILGYNPSGDLKYSFDRLRVSDL